MKTTLSLLGIMVFSALMLAPKIPKDYPPKKVLDQRADMAVKEIELKVLINKVEYLIAVDSIHLASIKQN